MILEILSEVDIAGHCCGRVSQRQKPTERFGVGDQVESWHLVKPAAPGMEGKCLFLVHIYGVKLCSIPKVVG